MSPVAAYSHPDGPKRSIRRRGIVSRSSAEPSVLDAVVDQHGNHWIQFGTADRSIWFSLRELQRDPRDVFIRLSGPGTMYLTTGSQNRFKALMEQHTTYRKGLVAAHPGWIEGHYVFGDGQTVSVPGCTEKVIVAFEPAEEFEERGHLNNWIGDVHPFARGQRLPLFVLAYAFIGPLIRFAPPGMHNPIIELVGDPGTGKSTLGVLASSVWGGKPGSDVGSGQSWAVTLASIDQIKRRYSDSHLTLDEGNLIGSNRREQRDMLERAVFVLASSEAKTRFGDAGPKEHIRLATLSTTNRPLAEMIDAPKVVQDALAQRMITIRVSSEHGVMDHVPNADARDLIEAIRKGIDENYGVAGPAFIRRLARWGAVPGNDLAASIERRMEHYRVNAADAVSRTPARVTKAFAMTFAAGTLAQKCGLIPGSSLTLLRAIRSFHEAVAVAPQARYQQDHLRRVTEYARSNWNVFIAVEELEKPLTLDEFMETAGFWRVSNGGIEIFVPSTRFQNDFPDFRLLMNALEQLGAAHTERGKNPKLTIKSPNSICRTGRVYCIRLPVGASDLSQPTKS